MSTMFVQSVNQSAWVIIDAKVDDRQMLIDGVVEEANVFVLDANQDGIEQITELLRSAKLPPRSLHLISHGAPGTLQLGNGALSLDTLQKYNRQLASWSVENILIYGCNVAAGDAGEEFVTKLNAITRAHISASSTPVGNAVFGGDWHLNVQTHPQPVALAIKPDAIAHYRNVLAVLPPVDELFNLNGDAVPIGGTDDEIRLTTDAQNQQGSAFSTARIDFTLSWDFTFELFFGTNDVNGADGIAFLLHNDPAGSNAIGNVGGGLGVVGVENSIAIEFDTFQNSAATGDPADDHTVIFDPETGLAAGNAITSFTTLPNIEDGTFHSVVVSWAANTNTLSYTFDGNPIVSIVRDVFTEDFEGEELIFWGFGSATGTNTNEHQVRLIDFNGRLVDADGNDIINTDSPGSPGKVSSGPSVFQFQEFIRFERRNNGRPYRGSISTGTEVGGLKIASLFDETYYLSENPDIAAAVRSGAFDYGFEHFAQFGISEGRSPSFYYSESTYLTNNPDVQTAVSSGAFRSGLQHYLNFGHIENRVASDLFDPNDYLLNNPDVADVVSRGVFSSAFDHYIEFGASEGRISTLLYEEAFYLEQNPDIAVAVNAGAFRSGFDHYIAFGQREGRDPGPLFDESVYLDCHPDIANAVNAGSFSSGMEHYFRFGRHEGRTATAVA